MKLFSLIYQGDLHPSTDEKVIPQDAYSKLLEAKEIIEKAKEDAKTLLEKTKEKCNKLKEKAKEAGKQEGLETFNEQILFLEGQVKEIRLQMQQMVLPLALRAAKKIVGKELEIFPETIVDIVLQTLAPISQSTHVTIFVSKEDKEILDKEKPKLIELLQQAEQITIQEKADVTTGGCIIKTEGGMINATLENQWRALERAFETYKPK